MAGYLPPPPRPGSATLPALYQHAGEVARAVRVVMQGGLNVVGTVTLTAGATSTVIDDARLTFQSAVLLTPLTLNAAGALATTWVDPATQNTGEATLRHTNAVSTDRTFRYVIIA